MSLGKALKQEMDMHRLKRNVRGVLKAAERGIPKFSDDMQELPMEHPLRKQGAKVDSIVDELILRNRQLMDALNDKDMPRVHMQLDIVSKLDEDLEKEIEILQHDLLPKFKEERFKEAILACKDEDEFDQLLVQAFSDANHANK